MLAVHGLTKSYAGPRPRAVFADVDLELSSGDYIAVMGESGVGKSTLLNLIAGFEAPQSGRVLIDDADVTGLPPSVRPVSMIFQENNLFAHLDVAANVGLGISPALRLARSVRSISVKSAALDVAASSPRSNRRARVSTNSSRVSAGLFK